MALIQKVFLALLVAASSQLIASPELDQRYGFRTVGVAVVGAEANPIFAAQVQKALETEVGVIPRFEHNAELSLDLVKATEGIEKLDGFATATWAIPLDTIAKAGVQAAIFAALIKDDNGQSLLQLALVASEGTTIYKAESIVDDPKSVPSYVGTGRRMLREMSRALPFDATVLNRDGYRVVLDHGLPELYAGLKLAAFTVELQNGRPTLVETGRLEIARSESRIAFGQVLVEKKPRQIGSGNKVRFEPIREVESSVPLLPTPNRTLSSLAEFGSGSSDPDAGFSQSVDSFSRTTHGRYGSVDVNLVGSLVTWNRTGASTQVGSDSAFYPGVAVGGEIWITRNWLVNPSFAMSLSGLNAPTGSGASSLNSQISQVQLMAGYRFRLINAAMTPMLTVKGGLSSTSYKVDSASSPLAAAAGTYSGFRIASDLDIPLSDKFGMGLTAGFLALPKYSQISNVAISGVSGWDFGMNSYYFWTQNFQFEAELAFTAHSVDFSSPTSTAVTSTSQNQRRFSLGARYYF